MRFEAWPAGLHKHMKSAGCAQDCSQCHGATGKGNGPAVSGLDPKPAIHANIPFEKLPIEYLYNVINYGGVAMGKSPNMPYWNLTIGQQAVADVMAYLTGDAILEI